MSISNSNELEEKLKLVFDKKGPTICEIKGKEDQDYIMSSFSKIVKIV